MLQALQDHYWDAVEGERESLPSFWLGFLSWRLLLSFRTLLRTVLGRCPIMLPSDTMRRGMSR